MKIKSVQKAREKIEKIRIFLKNNLQNMNIKIKMKKFFKILFPYIYKFNNNQKRKIKILLKISLYHIFNNFKIMINIQ